MAIMKRIVAHVGESSGAPGTKTASAPTVCPHCHRLTQLVDAGGRKVCGICGKPLR